MVGTWWGNLSVDLCEAVDAGGSLERRAFPGQACSQEG